MSLENKRIQARQWLAWRRALAYLGPAPFYFCALLEGLMTLKSGVQFANLGMRVKEIETAAAEKVLIDFAERVVQILIEMKAPGVQWL